MKEILLERQEKENYLQRSLIILFFYSVCTLANKRTFMITGLKPARTMRDAFLFYKMFFNTARDEEHKSW